MHTAGSFGIARKALKYFYIALVMLLLLKLLEQEINEFSYNGVTVGSDFQLQMLSCNCKLWEKSG